MTILLVQTFLLMLGAFLLGASLACLIRRALSRADEVFVPASSPDMAGVAVTADIPKPLVATDRFGRALAGDAPAVPPVFQGGYPVVEVQAREADAAPAPALAPRPKPPVAPLVASPEPVAQPPAEEKPLLPTPPKGPSYAEVAAVAAAAAAAAAAARLEAEAKAKAAEVAEAAPAVDEAVTADESTFETPVPIDPALAGAGDDLTRIHSIDGALKERLYRLGVTTFSAIAAWTGSDINRVSQSLGVQGRIEHEGWIEQARILAAGGDPGVAKKPRPAPVTSIADIDGERLHRIIGIDPKLEALLRANGVTTIGAISAWTAADIERFEDLIGAPGRVASENWVEQARFLTRSGHGFQDVTSETLAALPVSRGTDGPAVPQLGAAVAASDAASSSEAARSDYTGFRSVRSEALRGAGGSAMPALGDIDDLKRIRGIGVLIEKKLHSLGVTMYEQVANWTGADIDRVSQLLDFRGRIERENWIEQARILASGGQTEFSRRADRGSA